MHPLTEHGIEGERKKGKQVKKRFPFVLITAKDGEAVSFLKCFSENVLVGGIRLLGRWSTPYVLRFSFLYQVPPTPELIAVLGVQGPSLRVTRYFVLEVNRCLNETEAESIVRPAEAAEWLGTDVQGGWPTSGDGGDAGCHRGTHCEEGGRFVVEVGGSRWVSNPNSGHSVTG